MTIVILASWEGISKEVKHSFICWVDHRSLLLPSTFHSLCAFNLGLWFMMVRCRRLKQCLNMGFYYYLGKARPTDWETNAIKKFLYSQVPRRRGHAIPQREAHGEVLSLVRRQQKLGETVDKHLYYGPCRRNGWVKANGFRTDWLKYFQQALEHWGGGSPGAWPVVWYMEWLKQVNSGRKYESPKREVAGRWTLNWFVCLWKVCLGSKLISISRNWLALDGAVCPESAKPQMPTHQTTENKRNSWYKQSSVKPCPLSQTQHLKQELYVCFLHMHVSFSLHSNFLTQAFHIPVLQMDIQGITEAKWFSQVHIT